jgi:hypothetical protein
LDQFAKEQIPHSDKVYIGNDYKEVEKKYDMFVIGSDQVWNPLAIRDIYLMKGISKPKISYAASIAAGRLKFLEKIRTRNAELESVQNSFTYRFKSTDELKEHFIKHGRECNCKTPRKYLKTANKIIKSKKSLKKFEKDDGDTVYFNKRLNGIVFVSKKGYIRSFYLSDIDYFNRQ